VVAPSPFSFKGRQTGVGISGSDYLSPLDFTYHGCLLDFPKIVFLAFNVVPYVALRIIG